jgi:3-phenylpropionate/trans-cinnamate dioxygenase ferredoxin component
LSFIGEFMTTVTPRFVSVANLDELPDGRFLRVVVNGHGLVLARSGDAIYAFQGTCPHEKADLAQGRIEKERLICPRHLASFALGDGQASQGWKLDPLKCYPVQISAGAIVVDADAVERNPPAGTHKVWDLTRN